MTLYEYQKTAVSNAIYPKEMGAYYTILGLTGETGEVADKLKKVIRDNDGQFTTEIINSIKVELGDVLWYLANLANDLNLSLDDIAQTNINKIANRFANNTIHGNGDNR